MIVPLVFTDIGTFFSVFQDEELYQLFSSFNNLKDCIEAIRVVRDPGTSMGKGIAYVLFTTRVCV